MLSVDTKPMQERCEAALACLPYAPTTATHDALVAFVLSAPLPVTIHGTH